MPDQDLRPCHQAIVKYIYSLSNDISMLSSFVAFIKEILPALSADPDAIEAILHAWAEVLKVYGFSTDVFRLCSFLEELQRDLVRRPPNN